MASFLPQIKFLSLLPGTNEPNVGGKLYSYEATTNNPKDTYSNIEGTSPNSNPVLLDESGEATVVLGSGGYKFILTDANDNLIWTQDNVNAQGIVGARATVLSTIDQIKALDPSSTDFVFLCMYLDEIRAYYWDSESVEANNNYSVIIPDSTPAQGRWILETITGVGINFFPSIQDMVDSVGGVELSVTISKPYEITTDTTIPENITLNFTPGGYFYSQSGDLTLTINGAVISENYWIFQTLNIRFGNNVDVVKAEWFGLSSDAGYINDQFFIRLLESQPGVISYVGSNYYVQSPVKFRSNTIHNFNGGGIKLDPDTYISSPGFVICDMTGANLTVPEDGLTNLTINNMTVDGSKNSFSFDVSTGSIWCIGVSLGNSTNVNLNNIIIKEVYGNGMDITAPSQDFSKDNLNVNNLTINNCGSLLNSTYPVGSGILINNVNYSIFSNVIISYDDDNISEPSTDSGIKIVTAGNVKGNIFENIRISNYNIGISVINSTLTSNTFSNVLLENYIQNFYFTGGSFQNIIFNNLDSSNGNCFFNNVATADYLPTVFNECRFQYLLADDLQNTIFNNSVIGFLNNNTSHKIKNIVFNNSKIDIVGLNFISKLIFNNTSIIYGGIIGYDSNPTISINDSILFNLGGSSPELTITNALIFLNNSSLYSNSPDNSILIGLVNSTLYVNNYSAIYNEGNHTQYLATLDSTSKVNVQNSSLGALLGWTTGAGANNLSEQEQGIVTFKDTYLKLLKADGTTDGGLWNDSGLFQLFGGSTPAKHLTINESGSNKSYLPLTSSSTITAATNITSTTGNITATAGSVNAGTYATAKAGTVAFKLGGLLDVDSSEDIPGNTLKTAGDLLYITAYGDNFGQTTSTTYLSFIFSASTLNFNGLVGSTGGTAKWAFEGVIRCVTPGASGTVDIFGTLAIGSPINQTHVLYNLGVSCNTLLDQPIILSPVSPGDRKQFSVTFNAI